MPEKITTTVRTTYPGPAVGDTTDKPPTQTERSESREVAASGWSGLIATIATVVGIAVALVGAGLSSSTYLAQQNRDITARERDVTSREFEAKKLFFEKQTALYFEAVDILASFGAQITPNSANRVKNEDRFWQLYYGSLGAVEDELVDQVMVIAGQILNSQKLEAAKDAANKDSTKVNCTLDHTALLLSHCVKHSLECTWKVDLGEPPELRCDESGFQQLVNEEGTCFQARNFSSLNFACQPR